MFVFFIFASFFQNISKTAGTVLLKKNQAKPWRFSLQKTPNDWTSKNYILRDIRDFVKMSYSRLTNFVYALAQKLARISKRKFPMKF